MDRIEVGRDIDCRCTRCKMELAHTIIAIVDGRPARVKCNTCHTDRKYRAPKRTKAAPVRRTTTAKARATQKATGYEKQEQWNALMALAESRGEEHRAYNMRQTFGKGDVMMHKKFGLGVVMNCLADTKIRVCFRDGERIMVHAR